MASPVHSRLETTEETYGCLINADDSTRNISMEHVIEIAREGCCETGRVNETIPQVALKEATILRNFTPDSG